MKNANIIRKELLNRNKTFLTSEDIQSYYIKDEEIKEDLLNSDNTILEVPLL